MIYIDLPADLNIEDDDGRNVARLTDAAITPGAVVVAGAPGAWSWAIVDEVDEEGFVFFQRASFALCLQRWLGETPLTAHCGQCAV